MLSHATCFVFMFGDCFLSSPDVPTNQRNTQPAATRRNGSRAQATGHDAATPTNDLDLFVNNQNGALGTESLDVLLQLCQLPLALLLSSHSAYSRVR